jgi:hypothetical protein
MHISHLSFIFILATSLGSYAGTDESTGSGKYCHQTQFGACRSIHGLYGIYVENNGIVDLRTEKLFSTAGDDELDRMIRAAGDEFGYEVLGEFVVCPISSYHRPERTRAVQSVCVQSYTNTKVVKTKRK